MPTSEEKNSNTIRSAIYVMKYLMSVGIINGQTSI